MKRVLFKLSTLVIIVIIVSLLCSIASFRVEAAEFDPDPYIKDIQRDTTTNTDKIADIGKIIIGMLRGVGTILSVIVLVALGIKYMIGSVEEKAEYKKTMMPYLIGALLVFGITNLLPIIVEVTKAI